MWSRSECGDLRIDAQRQPVIKSSQLRCRNAWASCCWRPRYASPTHIARALSRLFKTVPFTKSKQRSRGTTVSRPRSEIRSAEGPRGATVQGAHRDEVSGNWSIRFVDAAGQWRRAEFDSTGSWDSNAALP